MFSLVPAQNVNVSVKVYLEDSNELQRKWCPPLSTSQTWQSKLSQRYSAGSNINVSRYPTKTSVICDVGVPGEAPLRCLLLLSEVSVLLGVSVVVVLLQGRKPSATVVLRTTAALLIAEVLASVGCEEP